MRVAYVRPRGAKKGILADPTSDFHLPQARISRIFIRNLGGSGLRSKFRTIWGVEAKCGKVTNFAHYFGFDVDEVYLLMVQRKCTVQLAGLLHIRSPLTSLLALVVRVFLKQEAPSIYIAATYRIDKEPL